MGRIPSLVRRPTSCSPILFAVAVLRYRLYDIEVIINRTVVLAAAAAFAGLGYTVLVVLVGDLVGRRTSGFWLSLLATALVALAFQPIRRWVVRFANRLAYGSRAQPYEALSDFSRRIAQTPSPETLLPAVADAAGRAVSARRATATLEVPGAAAATADWGQDGADAGDTHVVPVQNGGLTLGSIEVTLPKGRPLHPADLRLLAALADQTAVAFRNAALETQLAAHVAELDRTTRRACRLAVPDHRGGRCRTSNPRGRDLTRGPAPPGAAARRARPGPRRGRRRGGRATRSSGSWPAPTPRWRRCAS